MKSSSGRGSQFHKLQQKYSMFEDGDSVLILLQTCSTRYRNIYIGSGWLCFAKNSEYNELCCCFQSSSAVQAMGGSRVLYPADSYILCLSLSDPIKDFIFPKWRHAGRMIVRFPPACKLDAEKYMGTSVCGRRLKVSNVCGWIVIRNQTYPRHSS
jgi:hypothetical protein